MDEPIECVAAGCFLLSLIAAATLCCVLLERETWCRYLCPVGALLSLGNRLGLARAWLPRRAYGLCDLGVLARDELDCLQCNSCAAAVPPSRGPVRPSSSGTLT